MRLPPRSCALPVCLAACWTVCWGDTATPPPRDLEQFRARAQQILDQHRAPGAGIALVETGGVIWTGGVGLASVRDGQPVTAETHFRVGSISKTFVGLAIAQLAQAGRIDLDLPVREIAPEVPISNAWEASDPVRVAHLLEHTAGFDDMHPNEMYNLRHAPDLPLAEVLNLNPRSRQVRWKPGYRFAYSNPGYAVAGYLLEKVSGQPFEDYIRDHILLPLGMNTSGFRLTSADQALLARGYADASFDEVPFYPIYLRPAGNLHSSPAEMAAFLRMMLNRGRGNDVRILSPETLERAEQGATGLAARSGLEHTYGLGVFSDLRFAAPLFGHGGGIAGFLSYYGYSRQLGVGFAVLLNSTASGEALRELSDLAFAFLTRDRDLPAKPAPGALPPDFDRFLGYYRSESPRQQLTASVDYLLGGSLIETDGGQVYERGLFGGAGSRRLLVPVRATLFRLEDRSAATHVFLGEGTEGAPVMLKATSYGVRASPWPVRALAAALALSAVAMVTFAVYSLVWLARRILFGVKAGHLTLRLIPLIGVLSLTVFFVVAVLTPQQQLGLRNVPTVTIWLMTLLAPLFGAAGVVFWFGRGRTAGRWLRIHSLLASASTLFVCAFLAWWGLLGLRLWDY